MIARSSLSELFGQVMSYDMLRIVMIGFAKF